MTGSSAPTEAVSAVLKEQLVGFSELLRLRGLPVGAHELMDAVLVLDALDLSERASLYWGLRLAMIRNGHQLAVFDEAFRDYWDTPDVHEHLGGGIPEPQHQPERRDPDRGDGGADDGDQGSAGMSLGRQGGPEDDTPGEDDDGVQQRAVYSELEVFAARNFADYTPDDHGKLIELLAGLQAAGPWRLSRRRRPHRRGSVDLRRTVRASFRTEGDPVRQLRERPQLKRRRLTFVCDVSGSMEHYSRAVLELAHVALVSRRRVEAFAFATRLTRLTRELLERDPAAAVTGAMNAVVDWSGGTRVGDSLDQLTREFRASLQGSVVVIASDGWDLGDAEKLSGAADYLHRLAHRVIWVNPQMQDPAFEPLTRGMAAALPHVDAFLSCHNFSSFLDLIDLLEQV